MTDVKFTSLSAARAVHRNAHPPGQPLLIGAMLTSSSDEVPKWNGNRPTDEQDDQCSNEPSVKITTDEADEFLENIVIYEEEFQLNKKEQVDRDHDPADHAKERVMQRPVVDEPDVQNRQTQKQAAQTDFIEEIGIDPGTTAPDEHNRTGSGDARTHPSEVHQIPNPVVPHDRQDSSDQNGGQHPGDDQNRPQKIEHEERPGYKHDCHT